MKARPLGFAYILVLLSVMIGTGLAPASAAEALSPEEKPRIALLPVAAPDDFAALGRKLTKALARSLKDEVDLAELSAGVMAEPLETCILHPACVDRVLRAGRAEAVVAGQVEAPAVEGGAPRAVVFVIAPDWPVSYAERRVDADVNWVVYAARVVLALGRKLPPPTDAPAVQPTATAGQVADGTSADAGATGSAAEESGTADATGDGDEGTADDAGEEAPKQKRSRRDRRAQDEEDLSEERLPGEPEEETPAERTRSRQAPRVRWPERSPDGPWHGWVVELQGAAAYGALDVTGASQLAADASGAVSGVYRFAVREDALGWDGRLSVSRALTDRIEVGLEGGAMGGHWEARLSYYPDEGQVSDVSTTVQGVHVVGGARLRWILSTGRVLRPYVGLGAGLWWMLPGLAVPPEAAGPHEPFGPYTRLGLEPAFGMRMLLARRLFVGLEARALIDPLDVYLEREATNIGALPVSGLAEQPAGSRVVWSFRVGAGWLY